jgi:hypothetical protein
VTGRLALILVAGMTVAMIIVNATMNTNDAVDNFAGYYNRTAAYDIAMGAANMFSNKLYFNKSLRGTWTDTLAGGKWTVKIDTLNGQIQLVSTGRFPANGGDNSEIQQVVQKMKVGYFDRFVVLTDNDDGSVPWTTGDTAKGALHSNNTLMMDHYTGNPLMPVFFGPVTTLRPVTITAGTDPFFASGRPQSGVLIPFPTTFGTITEPPFLLGTGSATRTIATSNGAVNFSTYKEVHMRFYVDAMGNQMVQYYRNSYRAGPNGDGYGPFTVSDSTMPVPSSGIIYEPGVDVFVEGTVKGKLSVITTPNSSGQGGNIVIANDLLCQTDPKTNPASTDMIGLLAQNNIVIGNNKANAASTNGTNTFKVRASLVALTGGICADQNSSRARQYLDIFGSITQKYRRQVGDGSNSVPASSGGFIKKYMYDQRLYNSHALMMPETQLLVLESYLISTH